MLPIPSAASQPNCDAGGLSTAAKSAATKTSCQTESECAGWAPAKSGRCPMTDDPPAGCGLPNIMTTSVSDRLLRRAGDGPQGDPTQMARSEPRTGRPDTANVWRAPDDE